MGSFSAGIILYQLKDGGLAHFLSSGEIAFVLSFTSILGPHPSKLTAKENDDNYMVTAMMSRLPGF